MRECSLAKVDRFLDFSINFFELSKRVVCEGSIFYWSAFDYCQTIWTKMMMRVERVILDGVLMMRILISF